MTALVLGSLFSGVGGLDLACEQFFGARTVWQVENDPACVKVLERHWPDAKRYGDVTELDFAGVKPVDVLLGGYPCQPFSQAGKRQGENDDRHLWPHFARAIGALRPRIAVLENVAGHLSLGFDRVLGDLAELGYDARWTVVRASDVGACHRRARLFVIAYAEGDEGRFIDGDGIWHGRSRVGGGHDGTPLMPTPRTSDSNGAGTHGDGGVDLRTAVREHTGGGDVLARTRASREVLLPTPSVVDMGRGKTEAEWTEWTERMRAGHANGNGHGRSLDVEARLLPTPTARDHKNTGDFTPKPGKAKLPHEVRILDARERVLKESQWGRYAEAIARHERAFGRPAPAPCDEKRRLSPDFVEWMQMLPPGWTTGSRTRRLKMLGNAVVPAQALRALGLLAEAERHNAPVEVQGEGVAEVEVVML